MVSPFVGSLVNRDLRPVRIAGINSLRILLALVVAASHGIGVDFQKFMTKEDALSTIPGRIAWVVSGNLYNGQAAVIIFFLISGLCIHYPYSSGRQFHPWRFITGRFLRLGIPLATCLILAGIIFGVPALEYMGLWSLICEIIYYSAYPFLRKLRLTFESWIPIYLLSLLVVSFVLLFARKPEASLPGRLDDFAAYGIVLTSIVGLPMWILGCQLAEINWNETLQTSSKKIWTFRFAILTLSICMSILKFHGYLLIGVNVPYFVSFHLFAIPVFFWLRSEMVWHFHGRENRWLDWGGSWSYSLYICHPLVIYAMNSASFTSRFRAMDNLGYDLMRMIIVLTFAYLFYLGVENTSHKLARQIAAYRN